MTIELDDRKQLLVRLGEYMNQNEAEWQKAKHKAFLENNWFIPEFVERAVQSVITNFLVPPALDELIQRYQIPGKQSHPKRVGIVMAGNVPLVGFHDFLCVFLSGHIAVIKPSSKDDALIKHLVEKLAEWDDRVRQYVLVQEMLKSCDAYIATGSNNTSRYFEHYFGKYPSIIRKNRTSVALLTGTESTEQLAQLADDVYTYFGLGCRNVTKLYVPQDYNFIPLLEAFKKYDYLINHHKYKNNYDYNLAIHILNNKYYMTNGSILLVEDQSSFSPIAQLHYEFFKDATLVQEQINNSSDIQCFVGKNATAFGHAQQPQICDFADGVDTMKFVLSL